MYSVEKYTAEGKYNFTTIDGNDATQAHSKYMLTLSIKRLQCGGSGDSGLVKISALQAAILRALPQSGSPCELAENAHVH